MAADLHIHVFKPGNLTEKHFATFFSNTLGSKWFAPVNAAISNDPARRKIESEVTERSDSIWIGEVSWLKAGLFEDSDTYIPDAVQEITNVIGEHLPVVEINLIEHVSGALSDLGNNTNYNLADAAEVRKFLEEHQGWQAFTISW